MQEIKISFGIIVLNGEPFTKYLLRSLYPFAGQIIVVEGACPSAIGVAGPDGHSTDGTLKSIRDFIDMEDPEKKVILVSALDEGHSSGFWPGKTEMSQAYAKRATGEYLWQVDSDEFYHEEQLDRLLAILEDERPDAVSFPTLTFWGGLEYIVDGFYLIRDRAGEYNRLFAWKPGYRYVTHFPPTVVDNRGVNLRNKHWMRAHVLRKNKIFLYHYSLLFPQQVKDKVKYYSKRNRSFIKEWHESVYCRMRKPFRAHNVYDHIGWVERYQEDHPRTIIRMLRDIKERKINMELRNNQDLEELLSNKIYKITVFVLRCLAHLMATKPFQLLYRFYTAARIKLLRFFGYGPVHVDPNS